MADRADARTAGIEHFPELIIGLSYFSCGSFLGFILYSIYLPYNAYSGILMIPQSLLVIGATVAAAALIVVKVWRKRIVFIHLYLVGLGSMFLLIAGILLIAGNFSYQVSSFLGAIGYGMVYISGISYIFVRTKVHKHRTQRVALCHLSLAIGLVASVHYFSNHAIFLHSLILFGYFITYSSATGLALVLLNELLHGLGVYNYKKCLDPEFNEANDRGDNFNSALVPSVNHPMPPPKICKQWALTMTMILSRGLNGFMFNNIFLILTIVTQSSLIWSGNLYFISKYFILGGLIVGIVSTLSIQIKFVFASSLVLQGIAILVAAICIHANSPEAGAVFLWLFYLTAAVGYFVPDVAIMETSNLMVHEMNLVLGLLMEQLPIAITIYVVNVFSLTSGYLRIAMWLNVGFFLGIIVLLLIPILLAYPNTYQKSVLAIQNLIQYNYVRPSHVAPHLPARTNAVNAPELQQPVPGIVPTQMPVHHPQQPIYYSLQPMYAGQAPINFQPQQPSYVLAPQMPPGQPPVASDANFYPSVVGFTPKAAEASASNPTAPALTPETENYLAEQKFWPGEPNIPLPPVYVTRTE